MALRGISAAEYGSVKISSLGQSRTSANTVVIHSTSPANKARVWRKQGQGFNERATKSHLSEARIKKTGLADDSPFRATGNQRGPAGGFHAV
jgi:hypothetical protein